MKLGLENRKQVITASILGVVALGAVIYLGMQIFGGGDSAPAPAPVTKPATTAAKPESNGAKAPAKKTYADSGVTAAKSPYDPTLHPEVMFAAEHLDYTGTGRNIFSAESAPMQVAVPKPVASARMNSAPAIVKPSGPPPPPDIPLSLIGIVTHADGRRQAFLKHGDDIFVAGVGDIVMRQYRVTSVNANNVEIEDLPYNNRKTFGIQN